MENLMPEEKLSPVQVWIFENEKGTIITLKNYDYAYAFLEGLARVMLKGKYGFIDTQGKEVIPCKYDRAWPFNKGLAKVELDGKSFTINTKGEEVPVNN